MDLIYENLMYCKTTQFEPFQSITIQIIFLSNLIAETSQALAIQYMHYSKDAAHYFAFLGKVFAFRINSKNTKSI